MPRYDQVRTWYVIKSQNSVLLQCLAWEPYRRTRYGKWCSAFTVQRAPAVKKHCEKKIRLRLLKKIGNWT